MKSLKLSLLFALIALSAQPCQSQDYPNLVKDYAEFQKFNFFGKHQLVFSGVWGLGVEANFLLKHIVYAEAKAGYGWVIGNHSNAPDSFKKWRGWINAKAGYPILNIRGTKKGRWVVGRSDTRYDKTQGEYYEEYYYNIKVPAYYSLIVLAGYASEPTVSKVSAVESYSYQAPVYTAGLKWRCYLNAQVKAKDRTGSVERRFEFYAGLVIPVKDKIIAGDNVVIAQKSKGVGYELYFSFPWWKRLNYMGTFDVGIRSLGYNDEAQLYLGNTFYIGR